MRPADIQREYDSLHDEAPRPRCKMRGCRKVISLREAQIDLCIEHALIAWSHVQRLKHEPDYLPEAVKLYEQQEAARAWADEHKRMRNNPTPADMQQVFRNIRSAAPDDYVPPEPGPEFDPHEDIYYLRIGNLIKIGYSSQLYDRVYSYGPSAEVLAHHPGTRADERDLHRTFRPFLAKGREWYHPAQILMDHIDAVLTKWGEPLMVPEWTKPTEQPRTTRR